MTDLQQRIAENVAAVRERIAAAAARSGRPAEQVTLVAVTKYGGIPEIEALIAAGCSDLGESRPQDLWAKAAAIRAPVRWHMIGHLQRNKVRRTAPHLALLHSLDSLALANALQQEMALLNRRLPVLLEVNVSNDPAKHGFAPAETEEAMRQIQTFKSFDLQGLMAMAGDAEDPTAARADFRRLRALRDGLRLVFPAAELPHLSMGMSGDFEVAIEEGATHVRVGSALFAGLQ